MFENEEYFRICFALMITEVESHLIAWAFKIPSIYDEMPAPREAF